MTPDWVCAVGVDSAEGTSSRRPAVLDRVKALSETVTLVNCVHPEVTS